MSWVSHARRAVSFVLVLKGMVGFSVAALALFGVAVPYLGFEPTAAGGTAAAGIGALIGAALAIRG